MNITTLNIGSLNATNATRTLSESLAFEIDSRIAVPGKVDDIYATYPAWNSNCWAADVDKTCICVEGNGVLIAPDVILDAAHLYGNNGEADVANGFTKQFVDASGTVITRTVADSDVVYQAPGNKIDLFLMRLDSPVPAGVTFAKVVPSNFRSLIDLTEHVIPCILATNGSTMNVADLSMNRALNGVDFIQPTDVARLMFYQDFFAGMSGSPTFVLYNGELICIGTANEQNIDTSYMATYWKTQVNATMAAIGSSYTLTEAVLT